MFYTFQDLMQNMTTYMLSTEDPPQNKSSTQVESEGMGKNIPSKWTHTKSWGMNICITQIGFKNKSHKKGQRRSLYNT